MDYTKEILASQHKALGPDGNGPYAISDMRPSVRHTPSEDDGINHPYVMQDWHILPDEQSLAYDDTLRLSEQSRQATKWALFGDTPQGY